ncbi:MAG: three-Cys-motif partner protein TcmP [Syntrophales bacterium]|nr:three-Cys-motif partner protein TcmP [Syntrophales bacterium]
MTANSFFDEQTEQSLVKATIVAKYFDAWASVIVNTQKRNPHQPQKIAYIDLFAGPGRYEDGSPSTPLKILQKAIEKPDIRDRLVTLFNDKDEDNTRSLEKAIAEIPGIENLKYKPQVKNEEVGEEIVKMFEGMSLVPTLFFVDPFGYKGLTLRLVNSVLKDWGCDCLFFFNYNRISMGLSNPMVKQRMDSLFGEVRADVLRKKHEWDNPAQRELMIVEELCQAIKSYGGRYTLPFRFKDAKGKRTSHHLIFVSKDFRGYDIMKGIMAKESSGAEQGVPSFEYSPADFLPKQSLLFQLSRPLDDLQDVLLDQFAGRTLSMQDIYEKHSVDTPYIKSNYKEALKTLENNGKITAEPDRSKRRKGTFADDVLATFPDRKE